MRRNHNTATTGGQETDMNDQPAERLAQAYRDLMEQRRQDYQERQRRIAELETELSEPAAGYRQQSAAVMPGSGQDLAEYYDWRHTREQQLAKLRQQQQDVEHDTIPQTARKEATDIIQREARAAMPVESNQTIKPRPPKIKLPESW